MSKVIYEKRNKIAYITLNRTDALNALDDELNDELWGVWSDFDSDKSVDVAILTAEQYATMILNNSQQAIRSAKETIMDVIGRTLEDALKLETINAYSSLGDFTEARMRLEQFYSKGKTSEKA